MSGFTSGNFIILAAHEVHDVATHGVYDALHVLNGLFRRHLPVRTINALRFCLVERSEEVEVGEIGKIVSQSTRI